MDPELCNGHWPIQEGKTTARRANLPRHQFFKLSFAGIWLASLFTYCLWLCSHHNLELISCDRERMACKAENIYIYILALYRKWLLGWEVPCTLYG